MERMNKEELKKELKKLKDFKVYAFEGDVYVKAEDYKEIAIENKKLRDYVDNLDSENDNQAIEIEELKKENKKLKKYYDRDKEELMESCYGLAKENEKLKSDLMEDMKEITKLEKENKKLKKELEKLKSTYVYDAKQVRDVC